jgi:MFS transporter, DHA3 family, macrolide efflux protein
MSTNSTTRNLRTFAIVWFGQTISMFGSGMTGFAFSIWVWNLTGHATDLALFGFFSQLPQIFMSVISGAIVDRWNRKILMIVGDLITGMLTIIVLIIYSTSHLQIWHLYLAVAIAGVFEQCQGLAFEASISTLVTKEHYSRASSMGFLAGYGSDIIAPALAGFLYVSIGLRGIMLIDIATFIFAITTVLLVHIPQPKQPQLNTEINTEKSVSIVNELSFGWNYLTKHLSLLILLVWVSLFWLAHDLGDSLYSAMILARSNNDPRVLGSLASAAGIGGVVGALLMSKFGGFKRRIKVVQLGMIGASLSKIFFGIGRVPLVWTATQFCSSFNFPILGSSLDAIWLSKVSPEIQGRVFATRSMIVMIISSLGYLIAGPLADRVFEPAMKSGGFLVPIFGWLLGTEKGSGISLLYVICAVAMLLIGLSGYIVPRLRNLELLVPDSDR